MRVKRVPYIMIFLTMLLTACNFPLIQQNASIIEQSTLEEPPSSSQVIGLTNIAIPDSALIQPVDLTYLGAFRLPQGSGRPYTFEYGCAAMTFNPNGDAAGTDDGFTGSLFIMGHDRLPYGELPNGNQIAEITIPQPLISTLNDLYTAEYLQDFTNVLSGQFTTLEELPRAGMLYLDDPLTGPLIHISFGAHFQEDTAQQVPSHAWFEPSLSHPNFQGTWYIGSQSLYSVNGYLFEIPSDFAQTYLGGRLIATGRFRDGGWSGMGPELFAYLPWDENGNPQPAGTHLREVVLLQYANSMTSEDYTRALNNYSHADEWEGGAWLTTSDGRSAVIFSGTKAVGERTWYGWQNPADPSKPCVETELIGQFTLCRMADGTACPQSDLTGCGGHNDYRGWWSDAFSAQIIFYNPSDLAKVANGQMQPWQPQPYAILNLDEYLLHNPDNVEPDMLGTGIQRRYQIGEMAYDRENGLIYLLEWYADGAQPVVHVWKLN